MGPYFIITSDAHVACDEVGGIHFYKLYSCKQGEREREREVVVVVLVLGWWESRRFSCTSEFPTYLGNQWLELPERGWFYLGLMYVRSMCSRVRGRTGQGFHGYRVCVCLYVSSAAHKVKICMKSVSKFGNNWSWRRFTSLFHKCHPLIRPCHFIRVRVSWSARWQGSLLMRVTELLKVGEHEFWITWLRK